jgi:hypothetical protein
MTPTRYLEPTVNAYTTASLGNLMQELMEVDDPGAKEICRRWRNIVGDTHSIVLSAALPKSVNNHLMYQTLTYIYASKRSAAFKPLPWDRQPSTIKSEIVERMEKAYGCLRVCEHSWVADNIARIKITNKIGNAKPNSSFSSATDDSSAIGTPGPDAIELSDNDDNTYATMAVDAGLAQQRRDELKATGRGAPIKKVLTPAAKAVLTSNSMGKSNGKPKGSAAKAKAQAASSPIVSSYNTRKVLNPSSKKREVEEQEEERVAKKRGTEDSKVDRQVVRKGKHAAALKLMEQHRDDEERLVKAIEAQGERLLIDGVWMEWYDDSGERRLRPCDGDD